MRVHYDEPGHRALADTLRVLGVLKTMAARHEQIDVLEPPPKVEAVTVVDDLGDFSDHPF